MFKFKKGYHLVTAGMFVLTILLTNMPQVQSGQQNAGPKITATLLDQ